MKTKLTLRTLALLALLSTFTTFYVAQPSTCHAQGTAFTYQGSLSDNGSPASGNYDLRFTIYDVPTNGVAISAITNAAIAVNNGLFTVPLDFGAGVFDGSERWLEIDAVTNGGGAFSTLAPRQPVTATPYAVRALNISSNALAGYGDVVAFSNPANSFTGTFSGDGASLSNVNVTTLGGLTSSNFWQTGGNASTMPGTHFLGTTDNQPLELRGTFVGINRSSPVTPEAQFGIRAPVTNGFGGMFIETAGTGEPFYGYAQSGYMSAYHYVDGQDGNRWKLVNFPAFLSLSTDRNFIAGSSQSSIGNGTESAAVGGGYNNDIGTNSSFSVISGGTSNNITANSAFSSISGGWSNYISAATYGVIGGGYHNRISIWGATIGGGANNSTASDNATIGGGSVNSIDHSSPDASIAGGSYNEIGFSSWHSAIGGGYFNIIGDGTHEAAIAGGVGNEIGGSSGSASIGGGNNNIISANAFGATIPGGSENFVNSGASYAFAAGRRAQANHPGAFVWADSLDLDFASSANNQFSVRAGGGVRFTSGSGAANQMVSWAPGSGSWSFSSDRNLKENLEPVDALSVLEKVARLPIAEWSYIGYAQRHVGPMAQDFHAEFPLNENDNVLNDADLHGVALAAIQGLNQKLTEELKRRDAENAELKQRLEKLEQMMNHKNGGTQ